MNKKEENQEEEKPDFTTFISENSEVIKNEYGNKKELPKSILNKIKKSKKKKSD